MWLLHNATSSVCVCMSFSVDLQKGVLAATSFSSLTPVKFNDATEKWAERLRASEQAREQAEKDFLALREEIEQLSKDMERSSRRFSNESQLKTR